MQKSSEFLQLSIATHWADSEFDRTYFLLVIFSSHSSPQPLVISSPPHLLTQLNSTQQNDIKVHSRTDIGVPAQSTALGRKHKNNERN